AVVATREGLCWCRYFRALDTSEVKTTSSQCASVTADVAKTTGCFTCSRPCPTKPARKSSSGDIVFAKCGKGIEEPCRSRFSRARHRLNLRTHPFRIEPHDFIPLFSRDLLGWSD